MQKNGPKGVLLRTLGKQISNHVMAFLCIVVKIARTWKERQYGNFNFILTLEN